MTHTMRRLPDVALCVALLSGCCAVDAARSQERMIVDPAGTGDFRTIQLAVDAASPSAARPSTIEIRNGVYREKVLIRKSHLTFVGADRDSTRIVYAELREDWNKEHNGSDWGAGVVNIDTGVTDITFANLTIDNDYGWKHHEFNTHQFALRGAGTRIMLLNCNILSDGGDALSLWDKADGMYYHAACTFEGWVDYVCPRGWCYIRDSRFFGHNLSASIWHDGDGDKRQKFVIRSSSFDGVPGFPLGRNHRDGQIYLLDCRFSERMADRPIYHPATSATEWKWGDRHYFYNCHRDGGDFGWFKNNLESADGSPAPAAITARWTFDGRWDPEATMPALVPFAFLPEPDARSCDVDTAGPRLSWFPGRGAVEHIVSFGTSAHPEVAARQKEHVFDPGGLRPGTTYYWRVDEVTTRDTVRGELWSFTTAARNELERKQ